MEATALLSFSARALAGHRLRSALSGLGIAIGVASVILLTSIGEGTRRYVFEQFSQFGTNLLAINPGKSETLGIPGLLGGTTHRLTIDDVLALTRLEGVEEVLPMAYGSGRVEARGRGRSVYVYGVTPNVPRVWNMRVRQGDFWPEGDPRRGHATAVLGPTLKRELFGAESALGELVRIGGGRFRVVGVMEPRGSLLGIDIDDAVYIPTASAMRLLNRVELDEVHVQYRPGADVDRVIERVTAVLAERHRGREDFTVTSQAAMLEVFDNVMRTITAAVGAIAGISLFVGMIGILTTLWIAVGERTHEIGLLRAVGAGTGQVRRVFLAEAAALALAGGAAGLAVGLGLCALLRAAVPGLPVETPLAFSAAALVLSTATGLAAGVLPAQRAARMDPVDALRAE
ncbi:MAG TPA: ABC transporter permease [Thermoanaerobaculia bacterium]|nr:ABC transporter permease [Thermoanaerobaculia bacterium]